MSAKLLLDDFSALEDRRQAWKAAGHELQAIPLAIPVSRDISEPLAVQAELDHL
jgi:hypothetical protein